MSESSKEFTEPTKEQFDSNAANIAAAGVLKELGYTVDAGGPIYFVALAKFLEKASVEDRKLAETPEGLILVLRRHLDAKKNAEAEKNPPNLKLIFGIGAAGLLLLWLTSRDD